MILCVDPSITNWGYAVFDTEYRLIERMTIKMSSKDSKEKRWVSILNTLRRVASRYELSLIITERQFAGSLLQTMALCGIIAGERDVEIRYIAPLSWKKWGIKNHKASKDEVKQVVLESYPELENDSEHVCDSVGFLLAYKNNKEIGVDKKHGKAKKIQQKGSNASEPDVGKVRRTRSKGLYPKI